MLFNRHYARSYVGGYGEMAEENSKNFCEIRFTDISASGIRIVTDRKLSENQKLTLKIYLHTLHSKKVIYRKGVVVRIHSLGTFNIYGVKFIEVSQRDIIDLDEFIKRYMGVMDSAVSYNLNRPDV